MTEAKRRYTSGRLSWKRETLIDDLRDRTYLLPDGCWLWAGPVTARSKSPVLRLDGRNVAVTRALMQIVTGSKAHRAVRLCQECLCVNPDHFRWGPTEGLETRECSRCGAEKAIDRFKWADKAKTRRRTECNACCVAKEKQRKLGKLSEDPAAWKLARQAATIKHKYGMSFTEVVAMYEEQDGRCAICAERFEVPHVDHCHQTGKVRGLLCRACNFGIGFLRDQPNVLRSAIVYLERHAA